MKKFDKNSIGTFLATSAVFVLAGPLVALAAGPSPVNLLSAGNFVILSETGITNTGSHTAVITGNIGSSPITAAAMNDVFCSEITGTIFGVDAAYVGSGSQTCFAGNPPLSNKTFVDNAVGDMQTAYTDAAGRSGPTATELGAGNIGGMTLTPGLYKWSTDVNIATNLTLAGGPNDVWIFQIAGNLNIASGGSVPAGIKVVLIGGAKASNVFWQVGGGTGATLGTYATFNGTILSAKQVIIQTGAVLNGRALAQSQVTLDANTITTPTTAVFPPLPITPPPPGAGTSCTTVTTTVMSDTSNTIVPGNTFALAVTFIHPAWTASIPGAIWIWDEDPQSSPVVQRTVAFEKTFTVPGTILSATLHVAADNTYTGKINGIATENSANPIGDANTNHFQLATQDTYNVQNAIVPGSNTLHLEVTNIAGSTDPHENPGGLLYNLVVASEVCTPAGGITIILNNSGTIINSTIARSSTGGNSADGSHGGKGGNGGTVSAGAGSFNNGGATGGNGGEGGNAGRGGTVQTGNASSSASTTNVLNRNRIRIH